MSNNEQPPVNQKRRCVVLSEELNDHMFKCNICDGITDESGIFDAWGNIMQHSRALDLEIITFYPTGSGVPSRDYPKGKPVSLVATQAPYSGEYALASTMGSNYIPQGMDLKRWHEGLWQGCESMTCSKYRRGVEGRPEESPYNRLFPSAIRVSVAFPPNSTISATFTTQGPG